MGKIRKYMRNDYSTLTKWFKQWDNWTPCAESSIPEDTSFVYCDESNEPRMFSCYYKTNSDIAVMGFTIRDREFDNEEALDELFKAVKEDVKFNDFNILFYATDNASKHFVDKFVDHGGILTDNADAYIACMPINNVDIDFFECVK